MSIMKEFAVWYASFGWPVFPCKKLEKVPDCLHGCLDGTTDLSKVESWWNQNPNRNIGLLCGDVGNVHVIDIDVRQESGINGFDSLREFPTLPDTCVQDTPRAGTHILYSRLDHPNGEKIRNKNHWRPGIDIRSDGYYIVLSPSLVAGDKRYAWKAGKSPWEIKLATFPDFMRPQIAVASERPHIALPIQSILLGDNLKRASKYLAKVSAAVQGDCGHNKLLWAAQCMVHGFLLSDEEAFNILALEYNPRCNPPWNMSNGKDHKDFCRKISEARKNPSRHPKGWLLAANIEGECGETSQQIKASIKSLLGTAKKKKTSDDDLAEVSSPAVTKQLSYACTKPTKIEFDFIVNPFGYLGKFCSWANSNSMRLQPILALGGTLAFFGALFGRKVKDRTGIRTNVYCMGIGDSSAGKQHIQDCVRTVIDKVGCDQLLGACDFASDTSIESTLADQPSVVFMLDEVGHILMHLKSRPTSCTEKIVPTLMRVWSSAKNSYTPKAYADKERAKKIIQPCLSIYGTSTHERFIEGMSISELNDGWLSRCLVFHTDTFPFKSRTYVEPIPPNDICEFVNAWANRVIEPADKETVKAWQRHTGDKSEPASPTQIFIPTTDESEGIFEHFDLISRAVGEESPAVRCLWAKGEENARKIALIIAASTNYDNPVIDGACADYGCKLTSYLLRDFGANMLGQLSSSPYEGKKNKIWNLIGKRGAAGCGGRHLARLSGWSSKKERSELLEDLREAGRITTKLVGGEEKHWTVEYYSG